MKHLSLLWYITLQTLLWLKGRYIEALNCGIPRYKPCYGSRGGTLKHLRLWYTTLQTLLWLKGRYIEALNVTNLVMAGMKPVCFGYKPYYASRGGTLKHLSLFWYTTLQTLLWLKGRYIEALKFVLVYHVTNLVMAQGEVH